MTTVKSKGSRLAYHLTEGTAFTPIAPAAALPSGWVQVTNVKDVDYKLNEIEDYDDGDLEDPAPVMAQDVKPGSMSFSKKRNSADLTLQAMCDGTTLNAWVIVYADGSTAWIGYGRLKCTSGGKAENGDLKAKAMVTYEVVAKAESVSVADHA